MPLNFFGRKAAKTNPSENKVREDDFYFDLIEHYFINKEHTDEFQIIDDSTMRDIDFRKLCTFIC